MTRFTVLVAANDAHSSVRDAAVLAAETIAAHSVDDPGTTGPSTVIDLAELGPALLAARPGSDVADALARVAETDVLLVATPQAHGSYTGLLKVFLDRLPELGLGQAVAVPMAVVADLRTGRNTEDDLRVLLSDLGAWVVEPGLMLSESELAEPRSVIEAWADVAAQSLVQALAVSA
ncbi:FMN reductase [Lipingzhangella halophila]|uniref:FMN reductase n=1 Tax=Lipingzhangella halophila TaxID=1783352 RepID=A0A7W7RKU0_9ACTN|nr:NAD(P)H-dependent oxidoreductase [Lipingzhangella halophila]MBB4933843.1 FMN reductase [Lipingzhangella halophila]